MAHGTPDWGAAKPTTTVYSLSDMGELAARLGSIVTLDRRGDIVLLDDFNDAPLRWGTGTNIAGSTAGRITTHAKAGAACVQLTTAADVDGRASISHNFELPRASNVGIEVSTTLDANLDNLIVTIDLFTGSRLYYARMRLDVAGDAVQIYASDGFWRPTGAPLSAYYSMRMWYAPKLVWDWENKRYKRLIWNGKEYDISAYAPASEASTVAPLMYVTIRANGTAAGEATIYVDNFILTQNEP